MLDIDGSQGEGGGQIVRSALTLSAVTGKAFEVRNIRAGRQKPGLLRQHLTGVHAAREICGAGVQGAELRSGTLTFSPGPVQTRGFKFDVGTAGSATLVVQTILPALMIVDGNSSIDVTGGTHNMAAPAFEYLAHVYLPQVAKLGPRFAADIHSWGFYPQGGGRIKIDITGCPALAAYELLETGGSAVPQVTALVANLPAHIGERECETILRKAGWKPRDCHVHMIEQSPGPGNAVLIRLTHPNVTEIFTGFGRRGVQAEQVALQAWRQARAYMEIGAPASDHLADQLMLPLAIAAGQGRTSRFRTGPLSLHSRTNIEVIRRFLDIEIHVEPVGEKQNELRFEPVTAVNC